MDILSTTKLKQILLLGLIGSLALVIGFYLIPFMPGILMAITLYILMRTLFFKVTTRYRWKKWLAATLFIIGALLLFVAPAFITYQLLAPKIMGMIGNPQELSGKVKQVLDQVKTSLPMLRLNEDYLQSLARKAGVWIPSLLNATANFASNLVLGFFILYFMLTEGRNMERRIQRFMPLKERNVNSIWKETEKLVTSNAIGIPLLAIGQALTALVGYYFFGVNDYLLWAVITGVFSVVPIVGTAIIWGPLCIYLFAQGEVSNAIGLLLYSIIVITNMDNVMRFTILKKLGDVHPLITVLGIIVGVPMFGFMGLIFGPLIVSYLMLLINIYRIEFSPSLPGEPVEEVTIQ